MPKYDPIPKRMAGSARRSTRAARRNQLIPNGKRVRAALGLEIGSDASVAQQRNPDLARILARMVLSVYLDKRK
jgi:hypothetical protein